LSTDKMVLWHFAYWQFVYWHFVQRQLKT
jgi:hypothetical protein